MTTTFCGKCNHPLHWRECEASCSCRNDISYLEALPVEDPPPLIDDDRSAVIVLAVACGISGTIIALVLLAMRGLI